MGATCCKPANKSKNDKKVGALAKKPVAVTKKVDNKLYPMLTDKMGGEEERCLDDAPGLQLIQSKDFGTAKLKSVRHFFGWVVDWFHLEFTNGEIFHGPHQDDPDAYPSNVDKDRCLAFDLEEGEKIVKFRIRSTVTDDYGTAVTGYKWLLSNGEWKSFESDHFTEGDSF